MRPHDPFCIVCAVGANLAATVVAALTHDMDLTTKIAGITAVALAVVGSVKMLTPALADAIRTLGPALAELQKQREEIRKGSYAGQLEEVRKELVRRQEENTRITAEGNARVEDLNAKCDDLKRQNEDLKGELKASREEIHNLHVENRFIYAENQRFRDEQARKQVVQDHRIDVTQQAIADVAAASGVMEAIRPPESNPKDPG